MKSCVYILRISGGNYYIGSTNNLSRRLKEHQLGKKAGTRFSKTVELIFSQELDTFSEARKVEYRIKKQKSRKIVEKIIVKDLELL